MAGKIVRKKKDSGFVILKTLCLRDERLSFKAKGLHSYFMQLPEDWDINIADLQNRSTDGRDSVVGGMNELLKAGYVTRVKVRDSQNRFLGYDYTVYEERQNIAVDDKAENGKAVNGFSENGKPTTSKVLSEDSIILDSIKNKEEDKPSSKPVKSFEKMTLVERMREAYTMANTIAKTSQTVAEKNEANKIIQFLESKELRELYTRYSEHRRNIKAKGFKTLKGFYNSIKELSVLSGNNPKKALALIKQSEDKEWLKIVPLPKDDGFKGDEPIRASMPVF